MDIYCPKCREPWDHECLHEEIEARREAGKTATYDTVKREFFANGCAALSEAFGSECNPATVDKGRSVVLDELYDLFGDDLDGLMSDLEDFPIDF